VVVGQHHTRPLCHRQAVTVPIVQEAVWVPQPVWLNVEDKICLAPAGIRISIRLVPKQSLISTTLSQHYPKPTFLLNIHWFGINPESKQTTDPKLWNLKKEHVFRPDCVLMTQDCNQRDSQRHITISQWWSSVATNKIRERYNYRRHSLLILAIVRLSVVSQGSCACINCEETLKRRTKPIHCSALLQQSWLTSRWRLVKHAVALANKLY